MDFLFYLCLCLWVFLTSTCWMNNFDAGAAVVAANGMDDDDDDIYKQEKRAVILLRPPFSNPNDNEDMTLQIYSKVLLEIRKNSPQIIVRDYHCGGSGNGSSSVRNHQQLCIQIIGNLPTVPVITRRWEYTTVFERYTGPNNMELFYSWILFQIPHYNRSDQKQQRYTEIPKQKQMLNNHGNARAESGRQLREVAEIDFESGPWGKLSSSSSYFQAKNEEVTAAAAAAMERQQRQYQPKGQGSEANQGAAPMLLELVVDPVIGEGYSRCSWANEDLATRDSLQQHLRASSSEVSGITVAILDTMYTHPITGESGLVTPLLQASLPTWQVTDVLSRARERIVFIQSITASYCQAFQTFVRSLHLSPTDFIVIGNKEEVGNSAALQLLAQAASSSTFLYLERKSYIDVEKDAVQRHLDFAWENVGDKHSENSEIGGIVQMSKINLFDKGIRRSTHVCQDKSLMHHAYQTDIQYNPQNKEQWRYSRELCMKNAKIRWDYPGYYFTTTSAYQSCLDVAETIGQQVRERLQSTDRLHEWYDMRVVDCSQSQVEAYCHRSTTSHWSSTPFMCQRSFLLENVLPYLPDCRSIISVQQREMCNYIGIESNSALNCHLRQLNHTIFQTVGIFSVLTKKRNQPMSFCQSGQGFLENGEECVTYGKQEK